jgi:phosphatidate cytidylyltransferase
MKNFIIRAVTGVLFVAVLVGCILFNSLSFGVLFLIISALTVIEYGQLINKYTDAHINIYITALGAGYLFMAFMSYNTYMTNASVFLPYVLLLLYMMISELYLKRENPIGNWAHTMLSQVYIALPFALLNVISFQNDFVSSEVTYNPIIPLSVFIFLWMSDTGAYCIGTLIGKHRLFERISPKKSWEGSIGGAVVALIAAAVLAHFFDTLNIWEWMGLALTIVVFGTWGDLTESLFKRQLGIKDSGNILPGHGGMLDRFDSALMAIPAATVYLYLLSF